MKQLQPSETLPVGLLLALTGGLLDGYSYLKDVYKRQGLFCRSVYLRSSSSLFSSCMKVLMSLNWR